MLDVNGRCGDAPDMQSAAPVSPVGRDSWPTTPSDDNGSAPRCRRCGTVAAPGGRCTACGSFLPGNTARMTHGLRRYETRRVLPDDLKTTVDEFRAALIADQGGLEELTAARAGLCRLLVDAEVGRRLLVDQLYRHGIDSKPGRAAYDRLLTTMDRWQRIAGTLGLERRQRHVNPIDAVHAAVAEANR